MTDQSPVLSVRSGREAFVVNVAKFKEHSAIIQKLHAEDHVPENIDLTKFDVDTVKAFCKFINDAEVDMATVRLSDLLDLARAFQMKSLLTEIRELLTECSSSGSAEGVCFVARALPMISDDDQFVRNEFADWLLQIAAQQFPKLCECEAFCSIPVDVVECLLQRCDLVVDAECQVAAAAVRWLSGKADAVRHAFRLLRAVRVANLSIPQRRYVRGLLDELVSSDPALRAVAQIALNDVNTLRVCALAHHIPPVYKRCGNTAISDDFLIMVPSCDVLRSPAQMAKTRKVSPSSRASSRERSVSQGTKVRLPTKTTHRTRSSRSKSHSKWQAFPPIASVQKKTECTPLFLYCPQSHIPHDAAAVEHQAYPSNPFPSSALPEASSRIPGESRTRTRGMSQRTASDASVGSSMSADDRWRVLSSSAQIVACSPRRSNRRCAPAP